MGIAIVDLDFRFLQVNRALCEITGYSSDELTKLRFTDITHPEDIDVDVQLAEQVFKGSRNNYQIEKRYIKKNGEIVWIHLSATVIQDEEGKPLYGLGMILDMTDRKRKEQEYAKLRNTFEDTLAEIKTLKGLLPICSYCKKIRDGEGNWDPFEIYLQNHLDVKFTHGICQECAQREFNNDLCDG